MNNASLPWVAQYYQATRNTFLISDQALPRRKKAFVRWVCQRQPGLQLDGVVRLFRLKGIWHWEFFNADGSSATFCGNAARAVCAFLQASRQQLSFFAGTRLVTGRKIGKQFTVSWPLAVRVKKKSALGITGAWVNSGTPHFVLDQKVDLQLARKLRKALRSNVTFIRKRKGHCMAITFEKGVEGFTASCGTGAVAAAAVTGQNRIRMPGGQLQVQLGKDHVDLRGDVGLVAEVRFSRKGFQ